GSDEVEPRATAIERLIDVGVKVEQTQNVVRTVENRRGEAQLVRQLLRIGGIEVRGDDVRGRLIDVEVTGSSPLPRAADVRQNILAQADVGSQRRTVVLLLRKDVRASQRNEVIQRSGDDACARHDGIRAGCAHG